MNDRLGDHECNPMEGCGSREVCEACGYPCGMRDAADAARQCAECGSTQRVSVEAIQRRSTIRLGSCAAAATTVMIYLILLMAILGIEGAGLFVYMLWPTLVSLSACLASAAIRHRLPLEWWEAAMLGFTILFSLTGSALLALYLISPPSGPGASTSAVVVLLFPCASFFIGVVGGAAAAVTQVARKEIARPSTHAPN